ncbi:hypothetical protein TNIN_7721 [Trichonephila inaurata madagascariensis]|uniref:Uncharacterized protein n=1 Tax=Trichonephila inaurata madagascariensis TaxID=2747483 RepID=A0A8X6YM51_9ARAC|nr:hypothetical protein TNIN_7721 [Trichonephila inaurata madagascariensis]
MRAERQLDLKVKAVHSDIGGKFIVSILTDFFVERGYVTGQTLMSTELYIGIKPSIRHLRPFDSTLYVGTSRPLREKLDPKAKNGILKSQQSNSGAVLASPGLKFSDYEVVEGSDVDKTVNNIPVSLPQNSDSETEDEELSRTDSPVVPAKTTWKRVVVPRPYGSRNDIFTNWENLKG